jgi:hypothetical protein
LVSRFLGHMPIDYFLQHCDAHSGLIWPFILDCGVVQSFEGVNNERFELVVSIRNLKNRSMSPPALKNNICSLYRNMFVI